MALRIKKYQAPSNKINRISERHTERVVWPVKLIALMLQFALRWNF